MTEKKQKLWDYFILCARVLIAWTLLSFGWSKLTGGQFGISVKEMATSVKNLDFLSFLGIYLTKNHSNPLLVSHK